MAIMQFVSMHVKDGLAQMNCRSMHARTHVHTCIDWVQGEQAELVLQHTLLRTQGVVRGAAGEDDIRPAVRGKAVREAVPMLLSMLNGDIRMPFITHFCMGCCVDESGQTTREVQLRNVANAILNAGLLGGLCTIVPATSRWQSTSSSLSMLLVGILFHSILPRVRSIM